MTERVLIVTAEAGETQLSACASALEEQEGVEWERVVISGLPITEAQQAVHAAAASAVGFDWVLKLDGDMVPSRPTALRDLIERANQAGTTARYTEPVLDWYSDVQIEGVHLLRPASIPDTVEVAPPFFDRWIAQVPGIIKRQVRDPAILHAPDADLEQGLRFGLQRGFKAIGQGPRGVQWHRIHDLRRNWRKRGHPVVLAALAGAAVGVGLASDVEPSPDLVNRTSPSFTRLLASIYDDPDRSAALASGLTRPFGTWRTHLQVNGSVTELSRALAVSLRRRAQGSER